MIPNKEVIRADKSKTETLTIASSILTDKNLKPLDKMVLITILNEPDNSLLFQRSIAEKLGVTLGTVIKTFKNLEQFGYMKRSKRNGTADYYFICENGDVNNTDVKIAQPKNTDGNFRQVKYAFQKNTEVNFSLPKIKEVNGNLKNIVKNVVGMFSVEPSNIENSTELYSLETVLGEYLKTLNKWDEQRTINFLVDMSTEVNECDFNYTPKKLKEAISWLSKIKNPKIPEKDITNIQIEIDMFIRNL